MIAQTRTFGRREPGTTALSPPRSGTVLAALEGARIDVGDRVSVSVREGRIIVEPVTTVRGRHDLKMLVSAMLEGY